MIHPICQKSVPENELRHIHRNLLTGYVEYTAANSKDEQDRKKVVSTDWL